MAKSVHAQAEQPVKLAPVRELDVSISTADSAPRLKCTLHQASNPGELRWKKNDRPTLFQRQNLGA